MNGQRLVMTAEETIALGRHILSMTTADFASLNISQTVQRVTRIARNKIIGGDDGEELAININVRFGKRPAVSVTVDQFDDGSLKAAVERAEIMAREQPGEDVDFETIPVGPQEYVPANLWKESTAETLSGSYADAAGTIIEAVAKEGLEAAGFIGGLAKITAILNKNGMVAFSRETDAECTVTVRAMDGTASGWAGEVSRDWSKINCSVLASRAIELSKRGVNPLALEPGRRTVILSSPAMAQFALHMAKAYSSAAVEDFRDSPFTKSVTAGGTKIGMRVFDPRINVISDPTDEEAGYTPFYRWYDGDNPGIPLHPITWVKEGILQTLSYSTTVGLRRGHQYHPLPFNVQLKPMPGTSTMTLEEMIVNCEDGIFINHISGVNIVDNLSGTMTGLTRDGCFLIRNGKIERALKNFRFLDSPFQFLNRVVAIGQAKRSTLGNPPAWAWPFPPVVVPPLMIRDFNLAAMSDSV